MFDFSRVRCFFQFQRLDNMSSLTRIAMKQLLYASLLAGMFLSLGLSQSKASHIMGVDISYVCTGPGNCNYRIFQRVYFDCSGAGTQGSLPLSANPNNPPNINPLNFFPNGGCLSPVQPIVGPQTVQGFADVTPVCPGAPGAPSVTLCDTPNTGEINGTAEAVIFYDVSFCNSNCDSWEIRYTQCCRNGDITSLNTPSSDAIHTEGTIIDLTQSPCNNSPIFADPSTGTPKPPIAYICPGQSFTFNQGAFDPDGDSLSYELGPCLEGNGGVPVSYNAAGGYTPTTPMGPSWEVTLDSITGDLSFVPNPQGNIEVGVICIVVKEWRNGVQIGQVTRDMQVTVLPSCNSTNPTTGGIQDFDLGSDSLPAASISYNTARVCNGVPFCFEIPVNPTDPTMTYTLSWNGGIPGATFTDANDPTISDTIIGSAPVGRFCWTPPPTASGTYSFLLTVSDESCPLPGSNQFSITIFVEDALSSSEILYEQLDCNDIELSFLYNSPTPGPFSGIFDSIQWSGSGNLQYNQNANDSALIHSYPEPGEYLVSLFVQDTFGCRGRLNAIVKLDSGSIANAGDDIAICSNNPLTLGIPDIPNQDYLWTPSVGLSDDTIAQPIFVGDTLTQDSFFYTLQVTAGVCTTYDYVTVLVNPSLDASVQPANPSICLGDSVTLTASSTLPSGNSYLWSTGDTARSITVSPDEDATYQVISFNNGCASDPAAVQVNVQVGPQVNFSGETEVCPGGSTTIFAAGGDSYLWQPSGQAGQSIVVTNIDSDTTLYATAFDPIGCPGMLDSVTIETLPLPQPAFTADTVCEGLNTQFLDASTVSGGSVVAWEWDFGDNAATSSEQDPTYVYGVPGIFTVTLTATSDNGCINTITQDVEVSPTPTADFSLTDVCEGRPNQFADASQIDPSGSITSYTWDFGDGSPTDDQAQTTHLYDTYGTYNVSLTVSTPQGCADDYTKTVFVHSNPIPNFTFESACEDVSIQFGDASRNPGEHSFLSQWSWDFGIPDVDDDTSALQNPAYRYDSAGNYSVLLRVTNNQGCTADTAISVEVFEKPVSDFRYDETCENVNTQFISGAVANPNTPVANYIWDFGDGGGREGRNLDSVGYRYGKGNYGAYQVTLLVLTTTGCSDTITKEVVINPSPDPAFYVPDVCLYDSTRFFDTSTVPLGAITERAWDFGDGRGTFGFNPLHEYLNPGEYDVTLTITTDSGCVEPKTRSAFVRDIPRFLQLRSDSVCFGDPAALYAIAGPDQEVAWYNNEADNVPFLRGETAYLTGPLPFSMTYYVQTTSRYGCSSERVPIKATVYEDETLELIQSDSSVEIPGAIVEFEVGATIPLARYRWEFGDQSGATQPAPVHEYQYPGLYTVRVQVVDVNGCENELSSTVEVKRLIGIHVPSAFTPNGDDLNDEFFVRYTNIRDFSVRIFNRWGREVFFSDNPDFLWNGTNQAGMPLQEGVYVCQIRATDIDGNDIQETQTITLLR
jgi:gliding motility-associated-like protein